MQAGNNFERQTTVSDTQIRNIRCSELVTPTGAAAAYDGDVVAAAVAAVNATTATTIAVAAVDATTAAAAAAAAAAYDCDFAPAAVTTVDATAAAAAYDCDVAPAAVTTVDATTSAADAPDADDGDDTFFQAGDGFVPPPATPATTAPPPTPSVADSAKEEAPAKDTAR